MSPLDADPPLAPPAVRRSSVAVLLAAMAACATAPTAGTDASSPARDTAEADAGDPFALVALADRLAAEDLWPGFDFRAVPLAIYDGERTFLFRPPAPPEGFARLPGRHEVWIHTGRHPLVSANSRVQLGGAWTATLMPGSRNASPRTRAGVLIHEAFHVFQQAHHPGWTANEVELFTYPVDDAAQLALRRLETEALRRALAAVSGETSCWAGLAVELRNERFALLPAGAAAYERLSELNEGLATYVELRATGEVPDSEVLPREEFAPEAVRQRVYRSGPALARLLDRHNPGWRSVLAREDTLALDVLLGRAMAAHGTRATCAFDPATVQAARARAASDVEHLVSHRAERRRAYLEEPGWRLIVVAGAAPLFPQGFDPLNVLTLSRAEVLHTRFLRLGNDAGSLEVIGRAALTEAAGAHPLFNGVRTLIIGGLAREPALVARDGATEIEAEGVRGELRGATVEREGRTVTVRLAP